MAGSDDSDGGQGSVWSRPSVLASLILALGLVICVTLYLLFARGNDASRSTAAAPVTVAASTAGPIAPAATEDPTGPDDTSTPTATARSTIPPILPGVNRGDGKKCSIGAGSQSLVWPSDVQYQYVANTPTPFSKTYGPQWIDSDILTRCFAHSRMGAVFSAMQLVAVSHSASATRSMLASRMTGPGMGVLLRGNGTGISSQEPSADDTNPGQQVRFVGYQMVVWQGNQAVVNIAMRAGDTVGAVTLTQQWNSRINDWQVYVDDDGSVVPAISIPGALIGYTMIPGALDS